MSIIMPHEGGEWFLKSAFGTATADDYYEVFLYLDTVSTDDKLGKDEVGLVRLSTHAAGAFKAGKLLNEQILPTDLDTCISTTASVPQIIFPEYSVEFATVPTDIVIGDKIYGYAVLAIDADTELPTVMCFKEAFSTPKVVAADLLLKFTPVLRIGNTTAELT